MVCISRNKHHKRMLTTRYISSLVRQARSLHSSSPSTFARPNPLPFSLQHFLKSIIESTVAFHTLLLIRSLSLSNVYSSSPSNRPLCSLTRFLSLSDPYSSSPSIIDLPYVGHRIASAIRGPIGRDFIRSMRVIQNRNPFTEKARVMLMRW
jgi:hypothetical protein